MIILFIGDMLFLVFAINFTNDSCDLLSSTKDFYKRNYIACWIGNFSSYFSSHFAILSFVMPSIFFTHFSFLFMLIFAFVYFTFMFGLITKKDLWLNLLSSSSVFYQNILITYLRNLRSLHHFLQFRMEWKQWFF